MFRSSLARLGDLLRAAAVFASLAVALAFPAPVALAGPGYELDSAKPTISLDGEYPHGIAIDQASQVFYVTELTTDFNSIGHGQIEQFEPGGVPTAASPFVTGGTDFFTGVAVNPVTQGIYAYQTQLVPPSGPTGTSQMNVFSSTGVPGISFSPTKSTGPQLAADASGRVYLPNDGTGTVQIFSSSGALEGAVACTGCPGGAFSKVTAAALDAAGNLYVVDIAAEGRAIKFKPSGGSYVYDSTLQSGKGAVAVGVDPGTGDVFVGDYAESTYHVVAYSAAGVQFDDFAGGVVGPPPFGLETAGQIAANATTHNVYVSDPGGDVLWVFKRVASIPAPTATTSPASPLGQIEATLKAVVDPKEHGLTDCHFEYTEHSDFVEHGFSNATVVPCASKPAGSEASTVSAPAGGLTPATSYDYRISVTSNGGSAEGLAQAFETLPALAPSVTTGSASLITKTTATLGGSVNPHGGPISNCHFEYVKDSDFKVGGFTGASSASCLTKPSGTTNAAVSAKLSGLAAGTSYRFRLVATNNSGTSEATDQTFATTAETCATNPSLCPPPPEEKHETSPPPPPVVQPPPPPPTQKPLKCRKGFKKKTVHGKPKCVKVRKHRKHR